MHFILAKLTKLQAFLIFCFFSILIYSLCYTLLITLKYSFNYALSIYVSTYIYVCIYTYIHSIKLPTSVQAR